MSGVVPEFFSIGDLPRHHFTVQLRLLDSKNAPHVKLATTEDGSGMVLGGEGGYTQLSSRQESAHQDRDRRRPRAHNQAVKMVTPRLSRWLAITSIILIFASTEFRIGAQITTSQYDDARTSTTSKERVLTPANVNAAHFGVLLSYAVVGS